MNESLFVRLARVYQRFTDNVHFLSRLRIFSFTDAAINIFEELKAKKIKVKAMELRIAAIALEQDAVVITRNVRDFQRVPNLTIEDWST